jgi:hypothetical protein
MIDQDLPHGPGGDPEEMSAVLPGNVGSNEPQVGLMDKVGGLDRPGCLFLLEIRRSDMLELVVDEWKKLVEGGLVSGPRLEQQLCDVARRGSLWR